MLLQLIIIMNRTLIEGIGCSAKARKQLNSTDTWEGRRTAASRENICRGLTLSTYVRHRTVFGILRSWSLESSIRPIREKLCTGTRRRRHILFRILFVGVQRRHRTNSFYLCSSSLSDGFLNVLFSILDDKLNITFIFVATSCAREAIHTFISFS